VYSTKVNDLGLHYIDLWIRKVMPTEEVEILRRKFNRSGVQEGPSFPVLQTKMRAWDMDEIICVEKTSGRIIGHIRINTSMVEIFQHKSVDPMTEALVASSEQQSPDQNYSTPMENLLTSKSISIIGETPATSRIIPVEIANSSDLLNEERSDTEDDSEVSIPVPKSKKRPSEEILDAAPGKRTKQQPISHLDSAASRDQDISKKLGNSKGAALAKKAFASKDKKTEGIGRRGRPKKVISASPSEKNSPVPEANINSSAPKLTQPSSQLSENASRSRQKPKPRVVISGCDHLSKLQATLNLFKKHVAVQDDVNRTTEVLW
jgi:hypothetical protein